MNQVSQKGVLHSLRLPCNMTYCLLAEACWRCSASITGGGVSSGARWQRQQMQRGDESDGDHDDSGGSTIIRLRLR